MSAALLTLVSIDSSGVGQPGFVGRHGLASPEREALAQDVAAAIRSAELRTVRLAVVDQHGVPRGKMLSPEAAIAAMSDGLDFSGAIYSLDTGNQVFVPAFARGGGFGIEEFTGFPDVMLVPDPATFRVLPWADRTGWMLCDVYFGNGQPMPLDGRGLLRRVLGSLGEAGYDFLAGIEVEFYIVVLVRRAVVAGERGVHSPTARGHRVRAGLPVPVRGAAGRDGLGAGGDPRRPGRGWAAAAVDGGRVGTRAAGVQLQPDIWAGGGRRGGAVPLGGQAGVPAARAAGDVHVPAGAAELLLFRLASAPVPAEPAGPVERVRLRCCGAVDVGRRYVAGLLEHTAPMAVFAAPTVNGYKRFRPYSFAPDRVTWAIENRGALVRVQGSPGDLSSHVEMRLGEPAANPYLYMASNIVAGLDGIRRGLEPPAPVEADPYAADATRLPAHSARRWRRWTRTRSTGRRSARRWSITW